MLAEWSLADQAWWARVRRAAERKGNVGSKLMSDWTHELLPVLQAGPDNNLELVGPFGQRRWQPIPPERLTAEYKNREINRRFDELGRALGVGPRPGAHAAPQRIAGRGL